MKRTAGRPARIATLFALAGLFAVVVALRRAQEARAPSQGLRPEMEERAANEVAALDPLGSEPATGAPERDAQRAVPEPQPALEAAPARALRTVRGRVVDPDGAALAGIGIGIDEDGEARALAKSDAAGRFELALERLPATLAVEEPAYTSVRAAPVHASDPERELVLVAARIARVSGRISDASDAPLAGARIELRAPLGALARIPLALDTSLERAWSTESADDGRFALERVPGGVDALELEVALEGYVPARVAVSTRGRDEVEIALRLERERADELEVAGRVVDGAGAPVARAVVFAGGAQTPSGDDGRFLLRVARLPETCELFAFRAGSAPARVADFGARVAAALDSGALRLALEDLVLDGPALSISGRVVDARGDALEGWLVYLLDGSRLDAPGGYPPLGLESLVAGREFEVATDALGRFELGGLGRRSYRVEARDPASGLAVDSKLVPAGTSELVLRVPEGALRRVRGVVRTLQGEPAADVLVQAAVPLLDAGIGAGKCANGSAATTDAAGRFELRDVPNERAFLILRGPTIVPSLHAELGSGDVEVDVEVEALCRVQYEDLGVEPAADEVRALAADGSLRPLTSFYPDGSSLSGESSSVTEGRTPVLAVACDARVLVLLRGGAELRRIPLRLEPGRVVVVRP